MRNLWVISFALLLCGPAAQAKTAPVADQPSEIVVNRSPSCGCCGKWVEHLKSSGFNVVDKLVEDVQSIKAKNGVTPEIASCHTALVGGYVVEGHVPVKDIKKMLADKPKIVGIAVPGMPVGTPGMEMGSKKDAYQVIGFDKDHKTHVFSEYKAE